MHVLKNFLRDMGVRPKGTTLDRRDNDKGYMKSNCRWATRKQQRANRRKSETPAKIRNAVTRLKSEPYPTL